MQLYWGADTAESEPPVLLVPLLKGVLRLAYRICLEMSLVARCKLVDDQFTIILHPHFSLIFFIL